jgi:hypothetical protein
MMHLGFYDPADTTSYACWIEYETLSHLSCPDAADRAELDNTLALLIDHATQFHWASPIKWTQAEDPFAEDSLSCDLIKIIRSGEAFADATILCENSNFDFRLKNLRGSRHEWIQFELAFQDLLRPQSIHEAALMLQHEHQAREGEKLPYDAALQLVLKAICIELCRLSTNRHVRSETEHANHMERLISDIDSVELYRQCIQWMIQSEGQSKDVETNRLNKLDTHALRIIHSVIHPMHPDCRSACKIDPV